MTPQSRYSIALLAAAISAVALPAYADEGPLVLGRREHGPPLTLDPFSGALTLEGIAEADSSSSGGPTTTATSTALQQSLTLSTGGGIISKNFFTWRSSGTFGVAESWSNSPTENDNSFGYVHDYDLDANLLRTTLVPIDIYARRGETYSARSFAPTTKQTNSEYGTTLSLQSADLPTTLHMYHTETTQKDLGGAPQFKENDDHLEFQTAYDPSDRHHLDLNYQYASVAQDNPGSPFNLNYDSQNLFLNHNWQLDAVGRYLLAESLNYSSQTGSFPFDNTRVNEQLRMRHTENFETDLNYNFDQQDYSNSQSQTHQASGSFTHRLFESLTTSGQLGGSTTSQSFTDAGGSSGTADSDSVFTGLAWNYTKKVPYGVFTANLSLNYTQTDNGPVGATQQVLNDIESFPGLQPIVLTRNGINPNTIVVIDSFNNVLTPNVNYRVQQVGNTTQIVPLIGISPNETVRLNYQIDPLPGYIVTTTSLATGLRYDFTEGPLAGFGVYTQYAQQNQSIDTSSTSNLIQPDDVHDILGGVQYQFWKLTLRAEEEYRDSTLSPYDAQRFFVQYVDRFSERSTFSLSASQIFVHYPINNDNSSYSIVDGHFEQQISRELRSIITARWFNNNDDIFGTTMGFEEQGELHWKIRQTDIFVLLRHSYYEAPGSNISSVFAQFGITRNF